MEKETRISKYAEYRKNKGDSVKEEKLNIKTEQIEKEEKTECSKSTITVSYDDVFKGASSVNDKKGLTPKSKEILKYIAIGFIIALLIAGIVLLAVLLGR